MSEYLNWGKLKISDEFNPENINLKYSTGYVFTRESFGSMYKTRSLRIDLMKFKLNSENRRILNKVENLVLTPLPLPISKENYNWQIHKMGKDFYTSKFGPDVFSASKIKELITNSFKSNFNLLLQYSESNTSVGYVICYMNNEIMHYTYPFYDLSNFANNYGMGMMLKAILFAQESKDKYIYLGSASKPSDVYKLQFEGLEWFDGKSWQQEIKPLKDLITTSH